MPIPQYDWSQTPKTYLDKNDRLGLLIGSILAGGMGAATGYGGGDSAVRGIAGATAGFGGGANALEDNYSKMISDKVKRDQMQYEQNMQNDVFGLKKKEFEEASLPESKAKISWYGQRDMPDYNKIRDERVKRRLDIKAKRAEIEKPKYAPGEKEQLDFEYTNQLHQLPPEKLAQLRKDPEYIKALYAFRKQNMMNTAEPFVLPTEGSMPPAEKGGLWDYIKDRFGGNNTTNNIVNKGVKEAINNPEYTQEDLEFTAKKYGITTDEVIKRMKGL